MARKDWRRPEKFSAKEGRRRIGIIVSYNGTGFAGWQKQKNERTVQEEIEKAAYKLTRQGGIEVQGSGRTDSGVHAMGQCAHIEIDESSIPTSAFYGGLNAFLPKDVRVLKAWEAGRDFHARFSAMAREYRYFCTDDFSVIPFFNGGITLLDAFPDVNVLNSYAKKLIGTHDFTTYSCVKDLSESKFRDIYESEFCFTTCMYGKKILQYKICGNAFLYRMVRSLAGSMLQAAKEGKTAEEFQALLDMKDRSKCGKTAPSDGLYLWRVSYDPAEYAWFEEAYGKN